MIDINKIYIAGNLVFDPDVGKISNGSTIVKLKVATTRSWTDNNGQRQEGDTDWHPVVMFGQTAEIGRDARKGDRVFIEGSHKTRKFKDRNGNEQQVSEIKANHIEIIDRSRRASESSQPRQRQAHDTPPPVDDRGYEPPPPEPEGRSNPPPRQSEPPRREPVPSYEQAPPQRSAEPGYSRPSHEEPQQERSRPEPPRRREGAGGHRPPPPRAPRGRRRRDIPF